MACKYTWWYGDKLILEVPQHGPNPTIREHGKSVRYCISITSAYKFFSARHIWSAKKYSSIPAFSTLHRVSWTMDIILLYFCRGYILSFGSIHVIFVSLFLGFYSLGNHIIGPVLEKYSKPVFCWVLNKLPFSPLLSLRIVMRNTSYGRSSMEYIVLRVWVNFPHSLLSEVRLALCGGTTSVYFGVTYICFIHSRLHVFPVEPQYQHIIFLLFLSKLSFEEHT